MVKWLRHRPFKAVTGVRIPLGSPRANSSVGRAPALQAGGHRFKSCFAHHSRSCGVAVNMPACQAGDRGFNSRQLRQTRVSSL